MGLIVAVMPYLGFPNSWRKLFFFILGAWIAYLAYQLYKEKKDSVAAKQDRSNTYTDNRNEAVRP